MSGLDWMQNYNILQGIFQKKNLSGTLPLNPHQGGIQKFVVTPLLTPPW